ncbi:ABC transporter ATP-binding protein [Thermaerobacter composti]|uniref:ABC transporter ATP-binding protein n=1 Tax=Thermaerobacter composti TaxID=554949 RepID=A0ABZ0QQK1_9FIRM|nr:ABC transporter ATP-binding protein [Thermaerobacter composti]WPD19549.1 ABC transporter ATP-binding protein [Thermaerobacter composti]
MTAPVLEVRGLTRYFGGLAAVKDVDLVVPEGTIFGLIGPNGAGKTTTFSMIAGSLAPSAGRVIYRGRDVTRLKAFQRVRLGITRTHQIVRPFRSLTVAENVELAARYGRRPPRSAAEARERVLEVLEFVGLAPQAESPAAVLPVGQQKLLELARALATAPDLLLCDEICGGLTDAETRQVMGLLRKIRDAGTTIVYIEHDMRAVMSVCDRIAVLNFGQKLAEGTPDEIRRNPAVVEAYLGRAAEVGARGGT